MSVLECVQFYTASTSDFDRRDTESIVDMSFLECGQYEETSCGKPLYGETSIGFDIGNRVTLDNLKVVELNGMSGKITKYFANEGRWEVKMDGYSCAVKVTSEHLKHEVPFKPGHRVVLHGLEAKGMNGKKGTAKKFISGQGRWEIDMDDADCTLMIVPHKIKHEVKVNIGDIVTLEGLNMEDMNGKTGRVTHYNEVNGRYEVEIEGINYPVQVKSQKIRKGYRSESEDEKSSDNKLFKLGDSVTLQGLKIASMNGKRGKVRTFVADEGRWEVDIDDDWSVKVRPENLLLEDVRENKENDSKKSGRQKKFRYLFGKKDPLNKSKKDRQQIRLFKRSIKANE